MKEILLHDTTFKVILTLGIIAVAILIFLAVKMARKKNDSKAKRRSTWFSVSAGILAFVLVFMTYEHFNS